MNLNLCKMTTNNKWTWLLLLQGWTMLWVVIGHSPLKETIWSSSFDIQCHVIAQFMMQIAYSFHMPLFIMISGYLFYLTRIQKHYDYKKMIKDKLMRLGIPYITFILLAFLIRIFLQPEVNRHIDSSLDAFVCSFIYPFEGALQEMWFIASIFVYFLCQKLYESMLKRKVTAALLLCLALLCFFVPVNKMTGFLALNRAVHFFVFFYIGILIAHYNLEQILRKWGFILACTLSYIVFFYIDINFLTALSGCFLFFGIAYQTNRYFSVTLFSSFYNYTYQIL